MGVLIAQNKLMHVNLLLDRVLHDVMVRAGALPKHCVNVLHVVTHHFKEILARASLLHGIRALTTAAVLSPKLAIAATLRDDAVFTMIAL